MTFSALKNINIMSREKYKSVAEPATDELWAIETETYQDEYGNWYRVYPDGWCVQGGDLGDSYTAYTTKTITFLKPFINTMYFATVQQDHSDDVKVATINGKTNTSITFMNTYNRLGQGCWFACGYVF